MEFRRVLFRSENTELESCSLFLAVSTNRTLLLFVETAKNKLHDSSSVFSSLIIPLGLAVFFIFGFGVFQQALAQDTEVSGTVTDAADGMVLPGVNVTVKGTTTGNSTNPDVEYSITVASTQDTLVFSFVGT